MTAIAAIITESGHVHMAGDSFCGDEKKKDLCRSPKVYSLKTRHGVHLGVGLCGMVRQELILENVLRTAVVKNKVDVSDEWLKFELPDLLVKAMKERHATVEEKSQATFGESAYMLGWQGKIFYLDTDFGIWDSPREFAAIGVGKQYCLGALSALRTATNNNNNNKSTILTPQEQLTVALDAAHEWSIWVEPPYTYIEV